MERGTWQAGDEVSFLDEVGGGVVLRMTGPGKVLVRTDDGFEMEHPVKALVRRSRDHANVIYKVTDHQAGMVASNDERAEARRKKPAVRAGKTPKRAEDNSYEEVDLHLNALLENDLRMSDGEKLEYQLRFFERTLESAIRNGKRKLIVIHGVGEGRLREEVRKILRYYEGVRFHDANMQRYGSGATEVEILRH